jgi:hypothetical protein
VVTVKGILAELRGLVNPKQFKFKSKFKRSFSLVIARRNPASWRGDDAAIR